MRRTVLLVAVLAVAGACVRVVRRPTHESTHMPRGLQVRSSESISLTDTALVRHLCVSPDSVIAGRKACDLRNQAPFRTF